jgi:hypothetical protein
MADSDNEDVAAPADEPGLSAIREADELRAKRARQRKGKQRTENAPPGAKAAEHHKQKEALGAYMDRAVKPRPLTFVCRAAEAGHNPDDPPVFCEEVCPPDKTPVRLQLNNSGMHLCVHPDAVTVNRAGNVRFMAASADLNNIAIVDDPAAGYPVYTLAPTAKVSHSTTSFATEERSIFYDALGSYAVMADGSRNEDGTWEVHAKGRERGFVCEHLFPAVQSGNRVDRPNCAEKVMRMTEALEHFGTQNHGLIPSFFTSVGAFHRKSTIDGKNAKPSRKNAASFVPLLHVCRLCGMTITGRQEGQLGDKTMDKHWQVACIAHLQAHADAGDLMLNTQIEFEPAVDARDIHPKRHKSYIRQVEPLEGKVKKPKTRSAEPAAKPKSKAKVAAPEKETARKYVPASVPISYVSGHNKPKWPPTKWPNGFTDKSYPSYSEVAARTRALFMFVQRSLYGADLKTTKDLEYNVCYAPWIPHFDLYWQRDDTHPVRKLAKKRDEQFPDEEFLEHETAPDNLVFQDLVTRIFPNAGSANYRRDRMIKGPIWPDGKIPDNLELFVRFANFDLPL